MELLVKSINVPVGKLTLDARILHFFVANDASFNPKVIVFEKLMYRPIKIQSHYFNLTGSLDGNLSNLKRTFIYYYIELFFEVYNSFLG